MTAAPRWDTDGRDWPNRETSRFVDSGSIRWHVQVMGKGPPLLLLHGTGAATHSWRGLAPLLADDFTIIAPDLPGHGFTRGRPVGGMTVGAVSGAVAELQVALRASPELIVGHSAGAAIGVRMILDRLVVPRSMIGLDAALLPFPGLAAKLFPALAKLLFINPLAPRMFAGLARSRTETERFLRRSTGSRIDKAGINQYRLLLSRSGHVAGALSMMAEWDLDTLRRDLPRVQTPVLLVHGEEDAAIPIAKAREAAKLIEGAKVIELPGLGHLAHEEQPAQVAAIIRQFAEERACTRNGSA